MAATRTLSTLAFVTLAIAACQPAPSSGPLAKSSAMLTGGT